MKKTILIIVLTIPLAAGIIFTSYRSSAQKQKSAQPKMLYINGALNAAQKPAEAGEWIKFRQESELKINDHIKRITELKIEIKNNEEVFDALYRKKVAMLVEQIKFIKARLENYDKSPGNWESFRYGINNDMDTIEKALMELTVGNP
jgi:hypothetical protein